MKFGINEEKEKIKSSLANKLIDKPQVEYLSASLHSRICIIFQQWNFPILLTFLRLHITYNSISKSSSENWSLINLKYFKMLFFILKTSRFQDGLCLVGFVLTKWMNILPENNTANWEEVHSISEYDSGQQLLNIGKVFLFREMA